MINETVFPIHLKNNINKWMYMFITRLPHMYGGITTRLWSSVVALVAALAAAAAAGSVRFAKCTPSLDHVLVADLVPPFLVRCSRVVLVLVHFPCPIGP